MLDDPTPPTTSTAAPLPAPPDDGPPPSSPPPPPKTPPPQATRPPPLSEVTLSSEATPPPSPGATATSTLSEDNPSLELESSSSSDSDTTATTFASQFSEFSRLPPRDDDADDSSAASTASSKSSSSKSSSSSSASPTPPAADLAYERSRKKTDKEVILEAGADALRGTTWAFNWAAKKVAKTVGVKNETAVRDAPPTPPAQRSHDFDAAPPSVASSSSASSEELSETAKAAKVERLFRSVLLSWINTQLHAGQRPVLVNEIFDDLRDGEVLYHLLEVLSGEDLAASVGALRPGEARADRLDNVSRLCVWIEENVAADESEFELSPEGIVDGDESATVGAVWFVISSTYCALMDCDTEAELTVKLLKWAMRRTAWHPEVHVGALTVSFHDGRALLAILHDVDASRCPYKPSEDAGRNFARAFDLAGRYFSMPKYVDPSEAHLLYLIPEVMLLVLAEFMTRMDPPGDEKAAATAKPDALERTASGGHPETKSGDAGDDAASSPPPPAASPAPPSGAELMELSEWRIEQLQKQVTQLLLKDHARAREVREVEGRARAATAAAHAARTGGEAKLAGLESDLKAAREREAIASTALESARASLSQVDYESTELRDAKKALEQQLAAAARAAEDREAAAAASTTAASADTAAAPAATPAAAAAAPPRPAAPSCITVTVAVDGLADAAPLTVECDKGAPVSWLASEIMRRLDERVYVNALRVVEGDDSEDEEGGNNTAQRRAAFRSAAHRTLSFDEDLGAVVSDGARLLALTEDMALHDFAQEASWTAKDLAAPAAAAAEHDQIVGGGSPTERFRVLKACLTNYVNVRLMPRGLFVNDLYTDLADGRLLYHLLEAVSTETLAPYGAPDDQDLVVVGDGGGEATPAALQAVFDFARNRRLLPPNVDETSVLDGSPPDVLALVFAVFLMGAKRLFNVADEAALAERLLAFAKAATEPHADVNVQDLTVSWGDGRALLALVSAADPAESPYRPSEHAAANFRRALSDANRLYGVPQLVDQAEPFWRYERAMVVYLAELVAKLALVGGGVGRGGGGGEGGSGVGGGGGSGDGALDREAMLRGKIDNLGKRERLTSVALSKSEVKVLALTQECAEGKKAVLERGQEVADLEAAAASAKAREEVLLDRLALAASEKVLDPPGEGEKKRAAEAARRQELERDNATMAGHLAALKAAAADGAAETKAEHESATVAHAAATAALERAMAEAAAAAAAELARVEALLASADARAARDSEAELAAAAAAVRAECGQLVAAADAATEAARALWAQEAAARRRLHNELQELRGNVRVLCRGRPPAGPPAVVPSHLGDGALSLKRDVDGETTYKYEFHAAFPLDVDNATVYAEVAPLVQSVLDGYDVCVFAYGQTGSGKTHSVLGGGDGDGDDGDGGVLGRAIVDLFAGAGDDAAVTLSVLEIYNEAIRDLLRGAEETGPPPSLKLHLDADGRTRPTGLTATAVAAPDAAQALVAQALARRATAATDLNETSSRSHLIATLEATTAGTRGRLNIVDLAGSERVDKSGVAGKALKEAMNINKSLSALGDVIAAKAGCAAHVPYRNSALTHVLKDSLGEGSKTVMLACVNADAEMAEESYSTLNWAARAQDVALGPARRNVVVPGASAGQ